MRQNAKSKNTDILLWVGDLKEKKLETLNNKYL